MVAHCIVWRSYSVETWNALKQQTRWHVIWRKWQPNDVINQYFFFKNRLSWVMLPSKTLFQRKPLFKQHTQTDTTFFFYSNFYLILLFIYCFQCYNFFFYIFISVITFTAISLFCSGDVSTAARTDKAFCCHCHGNMLPAHIHGNIFCKRTKVYLSFPTPKQPYL